MEGRAMNSTWYGLIHCPGCNALHSQRSCPVCGHVLDLEPHHIVIDGVEHVVPQAMQGAIPWSIYVLLEQIEIEAVRPLIDLQRRSAKLSQRFTVVPRSALNQCTQGGSTLLRRQIALGQQVLHSGQLTALRRLHGLALHMACHGSLLERRGGIAPARIARALCLGSGRRCAAPTPRIWMSTGWADRGWVRRR